MTDGVPDRGIQAEELEQLTSAGRYRRILVAAVLSVTAVAVVPLLLLAGAVWYRYVDAFRAEATRPMARFAANGKQSLEDFLSERLAALRFVMLDRSPEELRDPEALRSLLGHMREAFGGVVDLGVIDGRGIQVAYAGPVDLTGRDYGAHPWFQAAHRRGAWVSDVYLGYRDVPHFVLAVHLPEAGGQGLVLRASIDADEIHRIVRALSMGPADDAFVVNDGGVLQTPSRSHGGILGRAAMPSLPDSGQPEVQELEDDRGSPHFAVGARIEGSPFRLVLVSPMGLLREEATALRGRLLLFVGVSVLLIVAVSWGGVRRMVNRAREADLQRAAAFHKVEYTNKMAALGRLSAGVAHEINNPLAIITEKAGLLKDLLLLSEQMPPREKMIGLVDSVLRSADRCGGITHRLLGFAKHMDVQRETIDVVQLVREVLGFLESEAAYRGLVVAYDTPPEPPQIVADRGQLQQVFLNIVNNAFAAVPDGGRIGIRVREAPGDAVTVEISDNGTGIPEEHLPRIFDPFFTTKKGSGTGLGLSITWGIVQKLGGKIEVRSRVGEGTRFTVTLPRGREEP